MGKGGGLPASSLFSSKQLFWPPEAGLPRGSLRKSLALMSPQSNLGFLTVGNPAADIRMGPIHWHRPRVSAPPRSPDSHRRPVIPLPRPQGIAPAAGFGCWRQWAASLPRSARCTLLKQMPPADALGPLALPAAPMVISEGPKTYGFNSPQNLRCQFDFFPFRYNHSLPGSNTGQTGGTYTHTHTHIHIYIYIACACVLVCWGGVGGSPSTVPPVASPIGGGPPKAMEHNPLRITSVTVEALGRRPGSWGTPNMPTPPSDVVCGAPPLFDDHKQGRGGVARRIVIIKFQGLTFCASLHFEMKTF